MRNLQSLLTIGLLLLASTARAEFDFSRPAPRAPLPGAASSVEPSSTAQRPHPAVVRVVAPERDGTSYGSGTLVDVRGQYGLVLTNWHVVREATETITVVFPDGFHSAAKVEKMDRQWDLAALVIWRPNVQPVTLSSEPPRPGDILTIAGYGRGTFRAASGRCTQYVAPSINSPFEMVELAASARQGDSGGPILNSRGELAGVLFGEGGGRTAGSYCGRVQTFLASVVPGEGSGGGTAVASIPDHPAPLLPTTPQGDRSWAAANHASADVSTHGLATGDPRPQSTKPPPDRMAQSPPVARPAAGAAQHAVTAAPWQQMIGATRGEQVKTGLAALGILSLLLTIWRKIGAATA